MTAARLFVAADNYVVARVHEKHFVIQIRLVHIVKHLNKVVKKFAAARVDDEHHFIEMSHCVPTQLNKFGNEDGRQIVYAKISEVFKVSASLSFTATAHARHNYYT